MVDKLRQSSLGRLGFAVRVAMFFGTYFFVLGIHVPYLPLWLNGRGLTVSEIGLVASAPMALRILVPPAMAFLADRTGRHREVVIGLAWAGVACLVLLSTAYGLLPILLLTLLHALCWSSIMPLTETVAVSGVRRAGLDYGRMRLWGSLSFIAASFAGGALVGRFGAEVAIWLLMAGALGVATAAHLMPHGGARASADAKVPVRPGEVLQLVRAPWFVVFLLAVGAVQGAHAVFYTFGTLHWQQQGISPAWAGGLWTIGVVVEVALFAWSGLAAARLGALGLICAGAGASLLRWVAMAFDPPLAALIPLQMLHGVTYGATHLGAIHFLARRVPERQAGTAQAIFAAANSGMMMLSTLLAGYLYASVAGRAYLAMAAMASCGLAAGLWLARWPNRAATS
jgi:PPP family 3-phenylpropionic acid transporter